MPEAMGEGEPSPMDAVDVDTRSRRIFRTSIVGILANVSLAVLKALVGLVARSVAITLDAVNNLTDALSSVITIVGLRLASKPADREHPYGHGRIEYFSAIVIAALVIGAGVSSLWESIRKVGSTEHASYEPVMLVVLVGAVVVKLFLSWLYRRVGKETSSDSLSASGADAGFDALISVGTLVSAGVSMAWGIDLDAWLGIVIALAIIKGGWDLLMRPVNALVGEPQDEGLCRSIKADIEAFPGVQGAYDLVLHSYGPGHALGSVNIGVADTMSAHEIGDLTHHIDRLIRSKYGIELTVGVHPIVTGDPELMRQVDEVRDICSSYLGVREVHGIYIDPHDRDLSVDVIADFDVSNPQYLRAEIVSRLKEGWPDYEVEVDIDRDFSE